MAGPLIWNGLNAKALTRDILINNAFFSDLRMGNQFAHNSSTGVLSGGVLSINGGDNTKFDLTAGTGQIITYTTPLVPTIASVAWPAFTAVTVTGLATQDETYILINAAGAIIQQSNYPTPNQRRLNIFIGRIGTASRAFINFATSFPDFTQSIASQTYDLFDALGPFNINGNQVSNNGANLQFQKSTGSMFFRSFNYPVDTYNPHIVSQASAVPVSFNYRLRTGTPGASTIFIDPGFYDAAGVLTIVPGGINSSTIQRVYLAPNGVVQVQYGQTVYPNLATATASIGTDPFIQNPALTNVTVLIAYIVVTRVATSLADPTTSAILRAPKFETGVGGGVNTVVSLQQAYNSSTQPQIVLSSLGGLQVFDNAAPIGGNLFQIANNAGSTNYLSVSATATTVAQLIDSGLTANTAVIANASKQLTSSTTTSTQLGFLSNVTSDIQTQINTKQGTNLIPDPGFESGTVSQWTLGTTGALTNGIPTGTPTFGSGASANLTISAQTSGALQSTTSLQYQHVTNQTVQGNMMATNAITIQPEFQGKVLGVKFAYQTTVNPTNGNYSGTSSNSFGWALWDITGAAWIGTAGQFNIVQNSGVGICTGTAQLPINTTSVRLIFYNVNATTATTGGGAITLLLDDFYFGPQTSANAPAMSDWTSYTPTGGFANTTYTGRWRRIGDSIEVEGYASINSAPGSSFFSLNLPPGLSIDTTKLPLASREALGAANMFDNTRVWPGIVQFQTTTAVRVSAISATGDASGLVTNANPFSFVAGNTVSVQFTVPIVGFSSNTVSSADTDTRVVAASYNTATAQSVVTTGTTIIYNTPVYDTHGSMNASTGVYTCSVSGIWEVTAAATFSGQTGTITILKNGVAGSRLGQSTAAGALIAGTGQVSCNAGDTIAIQGSPSANTTLIGLSSVNYITIKRLSGPAVVQATSVVAARAEGTATGGTGAGSIVIFPNITYDLTASYNASSGRYTVPLSGLIRVTATVLGTNPGVYLQAYLNGVANAILGATQSGTAAGVVSGSVTIKANAGDILDLRTTAAIGTFSVNNNWVFFDRLGGTG